MKKLFSLLLMMFLLFSTTLSASADEIIEYVASFGFSPDITSNNDGLMHCDYSVLSSEKVSVEWSDSQYIYSLTDTPNSLSQLYVDLLAMQEWDSCRYTVGKKARIGFNSKAKQNCSSLSEYLDLIQASLDVKASVDNTDEQTNATSYVLNTNTKKFHYPECPSVKKMKDKNKSDFFGTREEVISMGYVPCKQCNP